MQHLGVEEEMAAERIEEIRIERPKRAELSAEETRKRVEAFATERKKKLIAAVRRGKDRAVSS